MGFERERKFMIETVPRVYEQCMRNGIDNVMQKTQFDLVTNIDCDIEKQLSEAVLEVFPHDHIHGEENINRESIMDRTWTIDPIDGTCNMACGIPLFGVQCALFEKSEVVFSIVYLPHTQEIITAERGGGCFVNGTRTIVKQSPTINNAIISFGDYPHSKDAKMALRQHSAIKELYPRIAKIRMFGAACIDFASLASGRTDGTVVITKNLWDIAPGILLCKEAGAVLTNLEGAPYKFGDDGVVASANQMIADLITEAFDEP